MKAKEFFKNNKKKIGAGTMAALLLVGGATYAYFTDSNLLKNTFTFGSVDSTLVEESWDSADPSDHENLAPNAVIAKDPKVVNNGSIDFYTFIKVTVPVKDAKVASDDGTQVTSGKTDMFSWSVNSGWTLVDTVDNGDTKDYVYAWGSADALTKVAPSGETGTLFDSVKIANIIEGQGIEGTALDLKVKDYSIQTTDLTDADTTDPTEVWKIVSGQQEAN